MRHLVCELTVLQERQKLRVQVENRGILVAIADGVPHAIADKCPHHGSPLSGGRYEGGVIRCKEHGLEVDVRTGAVANPAKADFLRIDPLDREVRTFPVVVVDGKVYVEI